MEKPTIRELLIPPFSQNQATALAERVEAVMRLHVQHNAKPEHDYCADCFHYWPCPTIRALEGQS